MIQQFEYPHLVVLGAGNNVQTGISEGTVSNALTCSRLILAGAAPADLVICSGYGPEGSKLYPESEAEGIARTIREDIGDDIIGRFMLDKKATDTIGNVKNIADFIKNEELEAVGFVAARGHAERAVKIGKKILGRKIEIVPVFSREDISTLGVAKEIALRGLYGGLTTIMGNDKANSAYRSITAGPKRLLRRSERY